MPVIAVTDPDDPRLAPYRDIRERDLVGRDREFIAEGKVVVERLLAGSRHQARSLLIAEHRVPALGDMIAAKAAKNGWEGMIIYGCVRDVDVLAQTDLGVQALASHPLKTDKRGIGDLNVAVTFGGVTFQPGHFLYADNNGIVVSPQALEMP